MMRKICKLIFYILLISVILSCCKTTEKKTGENKDLGENVVTEISNTNSPKRTDSNVIQSIQIVPSLENQSPSERINVIYKDMIQDIKKLETTYSASYTLEKTSSLPFEWMDSLVDDDKYFYAIGTSKLCNGRSTAKKFAEANADENLKQAAIKFTGEKNIDVRGWELFEVCYKKTVTKKGNTYYTATVLIGIDRNLVVKN